MFSAGFINFDVAWENYFNAIGHYLSEATLHKYFNGIAKFIPEDMQQNMNDFPMDVPKSQFIWDKQNVRGETLLIRAVQERRHDAVTSLLTKTQRLEIRDEHGNTAVDYAFIRNEFKIADTLLAYSKTFKISTLYELFRTSSKEEQKKWLTLLRKHDPKLEICQKLMGEAHRQEDLHLIFFLHSEGILFTEKFFSKHRLLQFPVYWTEFFRALDPSVLSQSILFIINELRQSSNAIIRDFFQKLHVEEPKKKLFFSAFKEGILKTSSVDLAMMTMKQGIEFTSEEVEALYKPGESTIYTQMLDLYEQTKNQKLLLICQEATEKLNDASWLKKLEALQPKEEKSEPVRPLRTSSASELIPEEKPSKPGLFNSWLKRNPHLTTPLITRSNKPG